METMTTTKAAAEVVFTMGLPGAGKSTVLGVLGLTKSHTILDPDAIKASHPDYNPARPELLHGWSQEETERRWMAALASGIGLWVMDGTGTNAEKMVRRMLQAKAAGFAVRVLYVKVSLVTALARNAKRSRRVPEDVVRQKALDIATAFEIVAPHADAVRVFENE